jgi:hypothetical protein
MLQNAIGEQYVADAVPRMESACRPDGDHAARLERKRCRDGHH